MLVTLLLNFFIDLKKIGKKLSNLNNKKPVYSLSFFINVILILKLIVTMPFLKNLMALVQVFRGFAKEVDESNRKKLQADINTS